MKTTKINIINWLKHNNIQFLYLNYKDNKYYGYNDLLQLASAADLTAIYNKVINSDIDFKKQSLLKLRYSQDKNKGYYKTNLSFIEITQC